MGMSLISVERFAAEVVALLKTSKCLTRCLDRLILPENVLQTFDHRILDRRPTPSGGNFRFLQKLVR